MAIKAIPQINSTMQDKWINTFSFTSVLTQEAAFFVWYENYTNVYLAI